MTTITNLLSKSAVLAAAAALGSAAAMAQVDPAIKACATLRNDSERLTCYDRTVARLSGDANAKALTAQDLFGLDSQSTAAASGREEIPAIEAQVKELRHSADGKVVIELDNGQVWKQDDSRDLLLKTGDAVTIMRGALNSFKISAPSKRFARVRRLQ